VGVAEATKWAGEDTVALLAGELTDTDANVTIGTANKLASRAILLNS
jgi:hypothetical protein